MHDINSESGTKADIEKRNESYNAYVKNVTPKGSCVAKCFKAFIVGGCICCRTDYFKCMQVDESA